VLGAVRGLRWLVAWERADEQYAAGELNFLLKRVCGE